MTSSTPLRGNKTVNECVQRGRLYIKQNFTPDHFEQFISLKCTPNGFAGRLVSLIQQMLCFCLKISSVDDIDYQTFKKSLMDLNPYDILADHDLVRGIASLESMSEHALSGTLYPPVLTTITQWFVYFTIAYRHASRLMSGSPKKQEVPVPSEVMEGEIEKFAVITPSNASEIIDGLHNRNGLLRRENILLQKKLGIYEDRVHSLEVEKEKLCDIIQDLLQKIKN
ncbi:hypothetical protein PCE1_000255 [Barthelona sp. PCE]